MKYFVLSAVLSLSALLVAASPVEVGKRDVWDPPVLYPHSGTVWIVGNHHNVTWSTSNPPSEITNSNGQIVLAKGGRLGQTLASGFSLFAGRVEVQVPSVASGSDYTIVLFGDSGNDSAEFTIQQ